MAKIRQPAHMPQPCRCQGKAFVHWSSVALAVMANLATIAAAVRDLL